MSNKRLYRSRNDRMIAGVCGGLGQYLHIDPTLIRIALLFLALWGGGGVLAYFIAWLVIPEEPVAFTPPAQSAPAQTQAEAMDSWTEQTPPQA